VGERKEKKLVIEEGEAKIIQFIYDAFLRDTPLYVIKSHSKNIGFEVKGNCAVEKILTNPIYAGLLTSPGFKDYPGGLFPAKHEAIVDVSTWQLVQQKMKKPVKFKTIIDDEIPLRGVLKCHCGNPLSGAPSRGKSGKYFYYYKCRHSGHNNISAVKAHNQFLEICSMMSLPERVVKQIRSESESLLEKELAANKKKVSEKRRELELVEEKLHLLEEKWIANEISKETYHRWYGPYSQEIITHKAAIDRLDGNQNLAFKILDKNLGYLTDLRSVYSAATTLQKREFVKQVFDNNLYYQNGTYRTPTMLDFLSANYLKMSQKNLLFLRKKRGIS
jgi:site-specific DNA recombinase